MQIRQDKNSYRRKLEQQLEQNNNREIWTGLKKVLGHRNNGGTTQDKGVNRLLFQQVIKEALKEK